MRKLLLSLSAAFALSIAAVPAAHADVYTYTFTGGFSGSFSLDSSAAQFATAPGVDFTVPITGGTGNFLGDTRAYFYNPTVVPLNFQAYSGGQDIVTAGAGLYSGSEDSPTYLTGTFNLTDLFNRVGPSTLTVVDTTTSVATTPEPSSLALLGTGVLGFAGAARRRFKA